MEKINKYYREAYNNPRRYDVAVLNARELSDSSAAARDQIVRGVTDAFRDIENGIYKFK